MIKYQDLEMLIKCITYKILSDFCNPTYLLCLFFVYHKKKKFKIKCTFKEICILGKLLNNSYKKDD